jgi:hypothetical protein
MSSTNQRGGITVGREGFVRDVKKSLGERRCGGKFWGQMELMGYESLQSVMRLILPLKMKV